MAKIRPLADKVLVEPKKVQAMTTVAREFPDAVYFILGKTHPGLR